MVNNMERLLKTEEVAERWQCSKDYVLNQIPKGLEVIVLGKTDYRFDINDVLNYEKYLKTVRTTLNRMNTTAKVKKEKLIINFNENCKIV